MAGRLRTNSDTEPAVASAIRVHRYQARIVAWLNSRPPLISVQKPADQTKKDRRDDGADRHVPDYRINLRIAPYAMIISTSHALYANIIQDAFSQILIAVRSGQLPLCSGKAKGLG